MEWQFNVHGFSNLMDKITFRPTASGEDQSILFWGREVGYCGLQAGQPINWLVPNQCRLTVAEMMEVVDFIRAKIGEPTMTPHLKKLTAMHQAGIEKWPTPTVKR